MIMWRPGPARHREVDARFGYCPARRGVAPEDGGDLLAGNVQDRDHHAAAVRRGRDPVVADARRGDLNPGAVPAAGRWVAAFRDGVGGGRGEEFGVLTPSLRGPEGQEQRVAPCGQVTSPVSRQTASSAICATERPTPRLGRSRPPAWLASRSAPAPAASSAFLGPHTPLRASSHRPRPLTRERNPAPRTATFGVLGRGPRAVPDPSRSTGQTNHPADGTDTTGGSDRAEGRRRRFKVAFTRGRSHIGSAHGGLCPPGRVSLPGGSGIPLADAPGGPPEGHRSPGAATGFGGAR